MTNITAHASFENRSDVVRWSMDLRYQGDAAPSNARPTQTPTVRSPVDSDAAPIACFPPERDFLVRSRSHPGDEIRTSEAFRKLRAEHVLTDMTDRWGVRPKKPAQQKA